MLATGWVKKLQGMRGGDKPGGITSPSVPLALKEGCVRNEEDLYINRR